MSYDGVLCVILELIKHSIRSTCNLPIVGVRGGGNDNVAFLGPVTYGQHKYGHTRWGYRYEDDASVLNYLLTIINFSKLLEHGSQIFLTEGIRIVPNNDLACKVFFPSSESRHIHLWKFTLLHTVLYIGANCPDMSGTITIFKVLSHVPPDREPAPISRATTVQYCTSSYQLPTGTEINYFLPDIAEGASLVTRLALAS